MDIESAIHSDKWKMKDDVWFQKTSYFCKSRKTTRIKWVKYIQKPCSICSKIMLQKKGDDKKYKRAYCTDNCRGSAIKKHYKGVKHMNWKGGKYVHEGYVFVKCKGHQRADTHGYVREHILIAEGCEGRQLESFEVVHHKDEVRGNNEPSNLQIMLDSEHRRYHAIKNKLGRRGN